MMVFGLAAHGIDLYVSPAGDDGNAGTRENPLKTLVCARDLIRLRKQDESARVILLNGIHKLSEPLVLDERDGGTSTAPVTYEGESLDAIISGGESIPGNAWQQGANGVWAAKVDWPKGKIPFVQLWVDGRRLTRARTPNEGKYFFYRCAVPRTPEQKRFTKSFVIRKLDMPDWMLDPGVAFVGYPHWSNKYAYIESYDAETGEVSFVGNDFAMHCVEKDGRYYLENHIKALDVPGEWYFDEAASTLHVIPQEGVDLRKSQVVYPVVRRNLIVINGSHETGKLVKNLHFKNLTFMHTDAHIESSYKHSVQGAHVQQGALLAYGLHDSSVRDCEFVHLGEHGISLLEGCQRNVIRDNHIHDLGGGGVYLSVEIPRIWNDSVGTNHNTVENNLLHDGGHIYRHACGIFLGGSASYNTLSHNEICNFSWDGVHLGWSWSGTNKTLTHHNTVSWNHIHHIGNGVLSDLAAIYTLGQQPGTVIQYNHIHHISRNNGGYGGWGIYPDAGSSYLTIDSNLVHDTEDGGLHMHCYSQPHDDVVTNNIFAYSEAYQMIRGNQLDPKEGLHVELERNIICHEKGRLYGGSWTKDGKFSTDRNLLWGHGKECSFNGNNLKMWRETGRDVNSVVADPKFVDADNRDFHLLSDSPALALGFNPFPYEQAGIQGNPKLQKLAAMIVPREKELVERPTIGAISEDFESLKVGQIPEIGSVYIEREDAGIVVSDEQAASGKKSLKFIDKPGQKHGYNPHFAYYVNWDLLGRKVIGKFKAYLTEGTILEHQWRDWTHSPFVPGPTILIGGDGTLAVGGTALAKVPHNTWFEIQVEYEKSTWSLQVIVPGEATKRFGEFKTSDDFKRLTWIGFVSAAADKDIHFYLDDISIK